MKRFFELFLLLVLLPAFMAGQGVKSSGAASTVQGKPLCTATVTTDCIPNVNAAGDQVGGASASGVTSAATTGFDCIVSGSVLTCTLNGTVILTIGDDQTISGDKTFTGAVDASGATSTKPIKSGTSLPATCAANEVFFKTDATAGQNLYFCTAADTWTQMSPPTDPTDPSVLIIKDDFPPARGATDPTGELKWSTNVLSNIASSQAVGHPGIRTVPTGALDGDVAWLALSYGASTLSPFGTGMPFTRWTSYNVVLVPASAAYCFSFATTAGSCAGFTADTPGVSIYFDTTAHTCSAAGDAWSTTNWMFTVTTGGATRCVDSGVAFVADAWVKLTISSTSAGTILFSINGSVPISNPLAMGATSLTPNMLLTARSAGAKTLTVDFFSFKGEGLSR